MSKYKDKYGNVIKVGDVVLQLISLNMDRHEFPYITTIAKRKGRSLILDGSYNWGYLKNFDPNGLCVLTVDTDMRKVLCDFFRMQNEIKESRPLLYTVYKYRPFDAYEDLEKIIRMVGGDHPSTKKSVEDTIAKLEVFFEEKKIDLTMLESICDQIKEFKKVTIQTSLLWDKIPAKLWKWKKKKQ